jgi:hypothetical protein
MNFNTPPTAPEIKISPLAESVRPIATPDIRISPKAESLRETAPDVELGHEPSIVVESASPVEIGNAPTVRPEEPKIKDTLESRPDDRTDKPMPPIHELVKEVPIAQVIMKQKGGTESPVANSTEQTPTDHSPEATSLPSDESPTMPSQILKI